MSGIDAYAKSLLKPVLFKGKLSCAITPVLPRIQNVADVLEMSIPTILILTSRVKNRFHFPISRMNETLRFNQPIGKTGTEDRLPLKLNGLENMRPSVHNYITSIKYHLIFFRW